MIQLNLRQRRLARDVARAGALVSAAMLLLGLTSVGHQAVNAASSGTLVVKSGSSTNPNALVTGGGSATRFRLEPPTGAACSGDTATGGFTVSSFIAPAAAAVESLGWDPLVGPTSGNPAVSALFDQGTAFVSINTTIQDGALTNLGAFDFSGFTADVLVPGDYNVGYACVTKTGTLDKYWSVGFTFAAGLNWTVVANTPTTTTSSTSTTVSGATTTTVRSATTTTVRNATTTTAAATTTTAAATSTTAAATSTTVRVGSGAGTSTGGSSSGSSSGSSIPLTGSSPAMLLVWGVMLLIFGRMAILFGRPLRVIPPDAR